MPGLAELGRSGGEQEQSGGFARELFDELVFGAGRFGSPAEVVGLVDNHQIPAGFDDLGAAIVHRRQKGDAGQGELAGEKRVFTRVAGLDVGAARFVKDGEPQVEAAQQLDEPLVGKRLGHEDQGAFNLTGGQEALEDQARLDGFAQADLVGQQHAGHLAVGDLVEDVELVGDQVDATAEEAAHLGLAEAGPGLEGAQAQVEHGGGLGLGGHHALGGGGDAGQVGDDVLAHALAGGADVGEQAGGLLDGGDGELFAGAGGDGFADGELHAFEHRGATRIDAFFAGGGEFDRDASAVKLRN